MEISDYIPSYPYVEKHKKFNEKIFKRKEFYELKAGEKTQSGERFRHQELIARYAGPHTFYNSQLIFHTPGTGKTCAMIAMIEDTLKFTRNNALPDKKVLIIVPNEKLENQWKQQIAFQCTKGQYIPEFYFSDDPETQLSEETKTARLNKLIRRVYDIKTMQSFGNELENKSPEFIKRRYSNSIVVIDEAHNIKEIRKKDANRYYQIYNTFLHSIEDSKIFLLTGTPMVNEVTDIVGLLNLILPMDSQFSEKDFEKQFIEETENTYKFINKNTFFKNVTGLISYITRESDSPIRIDEGEAKWTRFIKTVVTDMNDQQAMGYLEAWKVDSKKKGIYENSSQAINFVYEEDGKYYWGNDASKKLMKFNRKGVPFRFINPKKILDNIKKYSSKYAKIIQIAKENPNDPIYIFNQRVSGADGAIFLYFLLKTAGIKTEFISGKEESANAKDILRIFNSPENRNAEKIQVLIGTEAISEGTSLTTVKHVITLSPWWNISTTEQAIARGIRADSLNWLPKEDRIIKVYQLGAESKLVSSKYNIDAKQFRFTETKDLKIKTVERVLKEIAWDCALNYNVNYKKGEKGSQVCDYQACEYDCYGVPKVDGEYKLPEDELNESTYGLFYADNEIEQIKDIFRKKFRKNSVLNINDLTKLTKRSLFLTVIAIQSFINNNETVLNKFGIRCYVKNDLNSNRIYLTENIAENLKLSDFWYSSSPFVNRYNTLSNVIDDEIYKKDVPLIKPELTKETLNSLDLITKAKILESAYRIYNNDNNNEKAKKVLGLFENNLKIIDVKTPKKMPDLKIPAHNIFKEEIPGLDYVDFTAGKKGEFRCFIFEENDLRWSECGKYRSEISKKFTQKVKSVVDPKFDKEIIYGVIKKNKKFAIVDKRGLTEEQKKKKKGLACTSIKVADLKGICDYLNIQYDKKCSCAKIQEYFSDKDLLMIEK